MSYRRRDYDALLFNNCVMASINLVTTVPLKLSAAFFVVNVRGDKRGPTQRLPNNVVLVCSLLPT